MRAAASLEHAALAEATRAVGGIFCLDGIAAGTAWVDIEEFESAAYLKYDGGSDPCPPPAKGEEWLFAPVDFDHLVLDATQPVDENVAKLLPLVRRPS